MENFNAEKNRIRQKRITAIMIILPLLIVFFAVIFFINLMLI